MSQSNKWVKVGTLLTSKPGKKDKYYIEVQEDVVLKKGQFLQVRDPRTSLEGAVASGKMSAEKAQEITAKIPDFVKFELILPPARTSGI